MESRQSDDKNKHVQTHLRNRGAQEMAATENKNKTKKTKKVRKKKERHRLRRRIQNRFVCS